MLMNFIDELRKLLYAEEVLPTDPLEELTRAQIRLLDTIKADGGGISLQVEEIYDIVKDADENAKEVKNAARRETKLLGGLVAFSDLLDDMLAFFTGSDSVHTGTIDAKREDIILACGLERFGSCGDRLDPQLHTVASAEDSDAPPESIIKVLENGYLYGGKIIRKAAVIVSTGAAPV